MIHDLRTNDWVLRYRERLGDRLLDWAGTGRIALPTTEEEPRAGVHGSRRDPRRHRLVRARCPGVHFRPVQADAVLDLAAAERDVHVLIEYDRTRRVDKNFDKFLRYETLLLVWWQRTDLAYRPYVVFVCQDDDHRRRFIYAADGELTGHLSAHTERGHEPRTRRATASSSPSTGTSTPAETTALARAGGATRDHTSRDKHSHATVRPHRSLTEPDEG